MIAHQLPSQHTCDSIHAFIAPPNVADVLLENQVRSEISTFLAVGNWCGRTGHPAIDNFNKGMEIGEVARGFGASCLTVIF